MQDKNYTIYYRCRALYLKKGSLAQNSKCVFTEEMSPGVYVLWARAGNNGYGYVEALTALDLGKVCGLG